VTEEHWGEAIREHEDILAALEARQPARLADLLRMHMENTFDRIKDGLNARVSV
jgi:DNA-binding GntR family transcriptional regulator